MLQAPPTTESPAGASSASELGAYSNNEPSQSLSCLLVACDRSAKAQEGGRHKQQHSANSAAGRLACGTSKAGGPRSWLSGTYRIQNFFLAMLLLYNNSLKHLRQCLKIKHCSPLPSVQPGAESMCMGIGSMQGK